MSDEMIEARKLTKHYGPVRALRNVSFEVRRGEVVGFLGPNGAGKTTTMKVLTCFIAPSEGTARVNGCDVFEDPLGVRTAIGYLPESTPLYTEMLTVEYLDFMARMRGFRGDEAHKRIKKAVEQTGIGDVVGKEIRALSKGYRQRVGLAQALLHEPPILILDEPMSGLDPNQAVEIRDLIKDIGKERTVILSTHNLAEVQVTCDRVLIIAKGKIVADDTADNLSSQAGKQRFEVTVLDKSNGKKTSVDSVREQLGKVDGVDSVRASETKDGELRFDVLPTGTQDLRPELFKAAVDGGFVLVGLGQRGQNLEDIFRELTSGRAGDAGAPDEAEASDDEDDDEDEDEASSSDDDDDDDDEDEASSSDEDDDEDEDEPDEDDDEGSDDEARDKKEA